jgi:hypothetical protein
MISDASFPNCWGLISLLSDKHTEYIGTDLAAKKCDVKKGLALKRAVKYLS